MRAEPQFHERFCLRQAGRGKAVGLLKMLHCLARRRIPTPGRLSMQITRAYESLLDLFDPRRL